MVIIDKLKKKFKQNEVLEKNEKEQTEETNTNLKDSLLDMIKQTIKKWDKNDIYAVSLYVYFSLYILYISIFKIKIFVKNFRYYLTVISFK